jgi:hypothetical protein
VVREGPDFVFWFMKIGLAFVALCVALSVTLFWLLKRYSVRAAQRADAANRQRPIDT